MVIFIHQRVFLYHLSMEYLKLAQLGGDKYRDYGDYTFADTDVYDILDRNKIPYYKNVIPGITDLTAFLERENSDRVSFMIQTMYDNLPLDIQEKLYNFAKDRCTYTGDKQWISEDHPNTMIVVYN